MSAKDQRDGADDHLEDLSDDLQTSVHVPIHSLCLLRFKFPTHDGPRDLEHRSRLPGESRRKDSRAERVPASGISLLDPDVIFERLLALLR